MSMIDESKAREEFTVFLRNSDVLTTTERGVTTVASETFDGTGSEETYTLANNVVRNIRFVKVGGVTKKAYLDYTPSYGASSSTITINAVSGTDNVEVSYDYSTGTNEKIWGDYPDFGKIDASDFPRVGFDFISSVSTPLGIGDTNYFTDKVASVRVYDNGAGRIENALDTLRSAVKSNQLGFYHFSFAKLGVMTPLLVYDGLNKKIREKGIDIELRFGFES